MPLNERRKLGRLKHGFVRDRDDDQVRAGLPAVFIESKNRRPRVRDRCASPDSISSRSRSRGDRIEQTRPCHVLMPGR